MDCIQYYYCFGLLVMCISALAEDTALEVVRQLFGSIIISVPIAGRIFHWW